MPPLGSWIERRPPPGTDGLPPAIGRRTSSLRAGAATTVRRSRLRTGGQRGQGRTSTTRSVTAMGKRNAAPAATAALRRPRNSGRAYGVVPPGATGGRLLHPTAARAAGARARAPIFVRKGTAWLPFPRRPPFDYVSSGQGSAGAVLACPVDRRIRDVLRAAAWRPGGRDHWWDWAASTCRRHMSLSDEHQRALALAVLDRARRPHGRSAAALAAAGKLLGRLVLRSTAWPYVRGQIAGDFDCWAQDPGLKALELCRMPALFPPGGDLRPWVRTTGAAGRGRCTSVRPGRRKKSASTAPGSRRGRHRPATLHRRHECATGGRGADGMTSPPGPGAGRPRSPYLGRGHGASDT